MIGNLKEKVLSNATKLNKAKVNAINALKALPPKTFTKKQKHEVKSRIKVPLKEDKNESKELSGEDVFNGSGLCIELTVPAEEFLEKVNAALDSEESRAKLFTILRNYHENRKIKKLVRELKLLLNDEKKCALLKDIRPLIPPEHVQTYDKLTETTKNGERILRIKKNGAESLGFTFRGGKEHGIGFYVTSVANGSPAEFAGLKVSDEIRKINGLPLHESIHDEVLAILKRNQNVTFLVKKSGRIPTKVDNRIVWKDLDEGQETNSHADEEANNVKNTSDKKDRLLSFRIGKSGLGCSIRTGIRGHDGVFVTSIAKGSLADRIDIKVGDQVLDVCGKSFVNIAHDQALQFLRGKKDITMVVRHSSDVEELIRQRNRKMQEKQDAKSILRKDEKLKKMKKRASFNSEVEVKEVERFGKPVYESDENEANLPAHSNYDYPELLTEGREVHYIHVPKITSLMMNVEKRDERIFVKSLGKKGAVAAHGFIKPGDLLLNVEGDELTGMSMQEVKECITSAMKRWSKYIEFIVACPPGRPPVEIPTKKLTSQIIRNSKKLASKNVMDDESTSNDEHDLTTLQGIRNRRASSGKNNIHYSGKEISEEGSESEYDSFIEYESEEDTDGEGTSSASRKIKKNYYRKKGGPKYTPRYHRNQSQYNSDEDVDGSNFGLDLSDVETTSNEEFPRSARHNRQRSSKHNKEEETIDDPQTISSLMSDSSSFADLKDGKGKTATKTKISDLVRKFSASEPSSEVEIDQFKSGKYERSISLPTLLEENVASAESRKLYDSQIITPISERRGMFENSSVRSSSPITGKRLSEGKLSSSWSDGFKVDNNMKFVSSKQEATTSVNKANNLPEKGPNIFNDVRPAAGTVAGLRAAFGNNKSDLTNDTSLNSKMNKGKSEKEELISVSNNVELMSASDSLLDETEKKSNRHRRVNSLPMSSNMFSRPEKKENTIPRQRKSNDSFLTANPGNSEKSARSLVPDMFYEPKQNENVDKMGKIQEKDHSNEKKEVEKESRSTKDIWKESQVGFDESLKKPLDERLKLFEKNSQVISSVTTPLSPRARQQRLVRSQSLVEFETQVKFADIIAPAAAMKKNQDKEKLDFNLEKLSLPQRTSSLNYSTQGKASKTSFLYQNPMFRKDSENALTYSKRSISDNSINNTSFKPGNLRRNNKISTGNVSVPTKSDPSSQPDRTLEEKFLSSSLSSKSSKKLQPSAEERKKEEAAKMREQYFDNIISNDVREPSDVDKQSLPNRQGSLKVTEEKHLVKTSPFINRHQGESSEKRALSSETEIAMSVSKSPFLRQDHDQLGDEQRKKTIIKIGRPVNDFVYERSTDSSSNLAREERDQQNNQNVAGNINNESSVPNNPSLRPLTHEEIMKIGQNYNNLKEKQTEYNSSESSSAFLSVPNSYKPKEIKSILSKSKKSSPKKVQFSNFVSVGIATPTDYSPSIVSNSDEVSDDIDVDDTSNMDAMVDAITSSADEISVASPQHSLSPPERRRSSSADSPSKTKAFFKKAKDKFLPVRSKRDIQGSLGSINSFKLPNEIDTLTSENSSTQRGSPLIINKEESAFIHNRNRDEERENRIRRRQSGFPSNMQVDSYSSY